MVLPEYKDLTMQTYTLGTDVDTIMMTSNQLIKITSFQDLMGGMSFLFLAWMSSSSACNKIKVCPDDTL